MDTYVYDVGQYMWICVRCGAVHVDMCTMWGSTCGYVYDVGQYMWICVRCGAVHVDMCTMWGSTCGYVYVRAVRVDVRMYNMDR